MDPGRWRDRVVRAGVARQWVLTDVGLWMPPRGVQGFVIFGRAAGGGGNGGEVGTGTARRGGSGGGGGAAFKITVTADHLLLPLRYECGRGGPGGVGHQQGGGAGGDLVLYLGDVEIARAAGGASGTYGAAAAGNTSTAFGGGASPTTNAWWTHAINHRAWAGANAAAGGVNTGASVSNSTRNAASELSYGGGGGGGCSAAGVQANGGGVTVSYSRLVVAGGVSPGGDGSSGRYDPRPAESSAGAGGGASHTGLGGEGGSGAWGCGGGGGGAGQTGTRGGPGGNAVLIITSF